MGKRAKREQRNAERRAAVAAVEGARTLAEAARHTAWRARFLAELAAQRCPACGSAEVAGVLYGLPRFTAELSADLDAGRMVLGGCCVCDDDPVWTCRACRREWGRLGDKSAEQGAATGPPAGRDRTAPTAGPSSTR